MKKYGGPYKHQEGGPNALASNFLSKTHQTVGVGTGGGIVPPGVSSTFGCSPIGGTTGTSPTGVGSGVFIGAGGIVGSTGTVGTVAFGSTGGVPVGLVVFGSINNHLFSKFLFFPVRKSFGLLTGPRLIAKLIKLWPA